MKRLRLFRDARHGSIAVIGALSFSIMIGMAGLAVEIGNGFAAKVRDQRIADAAALGGAVAYQASSQSFTIAQQTAIDVVQAHDLPASSAVVTQVTVNGSNAIKVTVTSSVPVALTRMLSSAASYNVQASAVASLPANNATACLTALSTATGNGVSVIGGAKITADSCAVNANSTIYSDNSSAKISAKQVVARAISDTAAGYNQNAITTTPTANNIQVRANAASDPLATNAQVKAALCQVNRLTGTSDPDYADGNTVCTSALTLPTTASPSGAADWTLSYQPRSAGGIYAYQTADYSCVYNIPAGNYVIGRLTVSGGCSVTFANGSNLKFDLVDMSGNGMTIGDGNLTIVSSFGFNSGSTITIGNGAHSFGSLVVTGGRTLRIGSGDLNVTGSVKEDGGSTISVAIGATDSVLIGNDGAGTAINLTGGSYLCFTANCAAPTTAIKNFSANGSIVTGGGSTLIINKTVTHVINGDLSLNGSSTLGSGLYIIKGNFTNNTGGTMTGADVTFALGGTFTLTGGTTLDLAAPATSGGYGIVDILVVTKSSAATQIGGGSQDKYSGFVYAPKSALAMDGGSSISTGGSSCLMLVVSTLSLTGSAALTTRACASQASAAGGGVVLVQ